MKYHKVGGLNNKFTVLQSWRLEVQDKDQQGRFLLSTVRVLRQG